MIVIFLSWIVIGLVTANIIVSEGFIGEKKRSTIMAELLAFMIGPILLIVFHVKVARVLRYVFLKDFTTKKIKLAKELCVRWHYDQVRKYTNEPYSNHPIAVSEIVSKYTHDETAIISALLHDVIEDTAITYVQILDIFGKDVANTVMELTKPEFKSGTVTKEEKFESLYTQLSQASKRAKLVKMADILHNISNVARLDPVFAEGYLIDKEKILPVLREGSPELHRRVHHVLMENKRILAEYHSQNKAA